MDRFVSIRELKNTSSGDFDARDRVQKTGVSHICGLQFHAFATDNTEPHIFISPGSEPLK